MSISAPIMAMRPGGDPPLESTHYEAPCVPLIDHLKLFPDSYSSSPLAGRPRAPHHAATSLLAPTVPPTFVPKLESADSAFLAGSQDVVVDNNAHALSLTSSHLLAHSRSLRVGSVWPPVAPRRATSLSESNSDITLCARTVCSTYTATVDASQLFTGDDGGLSVTGSLTSREVLFCTSPLLPAADELAHPHPDWSSSSKYRATESVPHPSKDAVKYGTHRLPAFTGQVEQRAVGEETETNGIVGEQKWEWEWEHSREYLCATEEILREFYGVS